MSMSSVKPTLLFVLVYMTQLVDASVCFGQYGVSFPFLSFFTQTLSIIVSNINTEFPMLLCQNIASVCLSGPFYHVCFLFFCPFRNRISHCPFLSQPPLPIPHTTLVTHCSLRKPGIRNPELRASVLKVLQILAVPIRQYQTTVAEDALRTGRAL